MDNIAIKIDHLSFGYEKNVDVINDISLSIPASKYISIIGHNGSGKSTLAKLILGLLEAKEGTIEIFGKQLNADNVADIRKDLGIVFQNPDNQFVGATVADDIAFGLENRQVPHEDMQAIIEEVATKVHMEDFLSKEPVNLSGGQKQRVAIAGVLAMNPKIIVFDEATAMLDPRGKREIRELIVKMKDANPELTLISITHDIEEANLSDLIYVMNEGKIIFSGTPEEVFANRAELEKIRLDLPFFYKFKAALLEQGLPVESCHDLTSLVSYLCQ